jgi:hypothetical protein
MLDIFIYKIINNLNIIILNIIVNIYSILKI